MDVSLFYKLLHYFNIPILFIPENKGIKYYSINKNRYIEYDSSSNIVNYKNVHKNPEMCLFVCRILHEIGHIIVAPKSRKNKLNFGIHLYKINGISIYEINHKKYYDIEEAKAILVENRLLELIGVNNIFRSKNIFEDPQLLLLAPNVDEIKKWWETIGLSLTNNIVEKCRMKTLKCRLKAL